MLYKRQDEFRTLCVLRVSIDIMNIDGVVLSDRNASSNYARFLAPHQWPELDLEAIFALSWTHPDDPIAAYRHKSQKCAEVLVPDRVQPEYLHGAYVMDRTTGQKLRALGFPLAIKIDASLFFQ